MVNLRKCAEIARCILLLNDASILEFFVNSEDNFYKLGGILEYDVAMVGADPRMANYRQFLLNNAKLKELWPCPGGIRKYNNRINPAIIATIHRLFRLNYLKDVLLPPNEDIYMGHYSSALSSMISFDALAIVDGLCNDGDYLREILLVISQDASHLNNSNVSVGSTQTTVIVSSPCANSSMMDVENKWMGDDAVVQDKRHETPSVHELVPCTRSDAIAFLRELLFLTRSLAFQKR